MPQPLRVVESPADRGVQAAAKSSRRDLLVALRDNIAAEIDGGVPARDLASLSLRLVKITEELEALDAIGQETHVASAAQAADEPWPAS